MAALTHVAKSAPSRRLYWFRLISTFVVITVGALFIIPFSLGVMSVWGLTHPFCAMGPDPGSFSPDFENIQFSSLNGLTLDGYFIPGTNGATIMLVPTYNMGRGGQLHYAQVFNEAGFNVLTFNSRVCTPQGWISLGYQEVEDVEAAYDYLKMRPDVDASRVDLHGFSSSGATSMMAGERMPEIRAVSAEGGYHDYDAVLEVGKARTYFDAVYQFGFMAGYRFITGDDISVLNPLGAIDQFGKRPLLLIYGTKEVSLPGAREMLAEAQALGVPAELWVVEGAGHGDYLTVAPEEYKERVIAFHRNALLGE